MTCLISFFGSFFSCRQTVFRNFNCLRNFIYTSLSFIYFLLTYCKVQSPSWEANWFAASQEIPHISRNPKVHYSTHKRPPTFPILCQPNPVLILTSHLLEICPNIIHPSTPRSPQWVSFLPVSPPRHYTPPSPHPYAPHDQPISFFYILSPAQYWVRSTNHLAPSVISTRIIFWGEKFPVINLSPCRFLVREKLERTRAY
jgi:hypothetical protein